jgi:hypothetical protein
MGDNLLQVMGGDDDGVTVSMKVEDLLQHRQVAG